MSRIEKFTKRESKQSRRVFTPAEQCSICGYPDYVTYREKQEDGPLIVEKTHVVECLGHDDVPAYCWNKHPEYTKFEKFRVRQLEVTKG